MNSTIELQNLIGSYLEKAKYCCELLHTIIPKEHTFLRAKVLKIVPLEGYILGVYYKFHGIGCYFKYSDGEIDIDFGSEDRCDGFDLHRLKFFFDGMEDKRLYLPLIDNSVFKRQFSELVARGVIAKSHFAPSEHLYYLQVHV